MALQFLSCCSILELVKLIKTREQKNGLMAALLREHKDFFGFLKEGDLIDAKVIRKEASGVFFDLGLHGTGIVYGAEFYQASSAIKKLSTGDLIPAKIVNPENDDGYVELSLRDAGEEMAWKDIREKQEKGEHIEVVVTNANKGGLIASVNGVSGFLPASQLSSDHYPKLGDADPAALVGELRKFIDQTLTIKILDFDIAEGKLILSERAAEEEMLKGALENYHVGDIVKGEITGIVSFGAFIRFGKENIEGLIHISELDWQLVENPADIVTAGQNVQAKIIDIKNSRVSLSLKQLKKDPWEDIDTKYKKGDIVKAKVVKFSSYGAFAELEKNILGLVHISEFGSREKMEGQLAVGKKYDFKIMLIDAKGHKIALTMKTEKEST